MFDEMVRAGAKATKLAADNPVVQAVSILDPFGLAPAMLIGAGDAAEDYLDEEERKAGARRR